MSHGRIFNHRYTYKPRTLFSLREVETVHDKLLMVIVQVITSSSQSCGGFAG
jgi:hypothetical protein